MHEDDNKFQIVFLTTLMEHSHTHKRLNTQDPSPILSKYQIYEELYFLSQMRFYTVKIMDPISLSLRAALLCDLACEGLVILNNNIVRCTGKQTRDTILNETLSIIRNSSCTIHELLVALNGESFFKNRPLHIKRLRHKIGKRLEERGAISYENSGILFKGKARLDNNSKREILDELFQFLKNGGGIRKKALVACIMYCNALTPLFISQPLKDSADMGAMATSVVKKMKVAYLGECKIERFVHGVIDTLYKL